MEKVIGRENAVILLAAGSKNIIGNATSHKSRLEEWKKLTKNQRNINNDN
jgi:hypothetical protein